MTKKKKYIIIAVFAVIGIILGSTYSWYEWISTNTDVTLTIGGVTVTYEAGTDVTGISLRPVSDKETGYEEGYAIKKNITVSSSKETYFSLYLNAEVFDEGLKHESLKWEIYDDGLLLSMGNLRDINEGDTLTLINNLKINDMTRNLELYIYIDGNMKNPETMQNQDYSLSLNASATDEEPEYIIDIPYSEVNDSIPGTLAGSGSSSDPYLIESIEDLIALSNSVNSGITYEDKYISLKQTLNFDYEGSYVDSTNTQLFGDYNGDGTISGIKEEVTSGQGFVPIGINSIETVTKTFKGIFRGNNNAIMSLYINYEEGISNYASSFIGLFGVVETGTIEGISVSGNISAISPNTEIDIGGTVGRIGSNSKLVNIKNYSLIYGENIGEEAVIIGGIVGSIKDYCQVVNSINEKNVTINSYAKNKSVSGGIVGHNEDGFVNNCTNYGSFDNLTLNDTSNTGGIVGYNYGTSVIENSVNYGDIIINTNSYDYVGNVFVGGIVGTNRGSVNKSTNYDEITVSVINNNVVIGGISGYNYGRISESINVKNSNLYGKSKNKTTYVGGIAGINNGSDANIVSNYNIADIEGESENTVIIGGISGWTKNSVISNNYNIGNVFKSGNATAGGVGGIVGSNTGTSSLIKNSYYLNTTATNVYGSGDDTLITNSGPKTIEEMKTSAFVDLLNTGLEIPVWVSDTNNINNGYPILSFQNE